MVKTLLVVPDIFRSEGGIARIMRLYLKALCEATGAGESVGYIALNDRPEDTACADNYATSSLSLRLSCDCSKLRFITAILRHGFSSDRVICGHLHHLVVVWFLGLFRPGMPYYLVAHGIEVWRPYTWLEKRSLRGARRVLCVSEYTRRQMLRFDSGLDPARLVVLPNTFDPRFAGQGPANPALSSQLSAHSSPIANAQSSRRDDGPRILVVSRLVASDPYKGVDTMIEAMPVILREYPKAQLRIVGGGDDLPRLQEIAETLKLGNAVTFTGILSDEELRREYQACDLFALPSRKEGFGLVYLEAMAYGKPCLAARAGGAPEVVNDDVGAVVEYGNTDQIALAVADLLRHPREAAAMRARVEAFSFLRFQQRLAVALTP